MAEEMDLLALMSRRERSLHQRANPESLAGRVTRSTIEVAVRARNTPEEQAAS